MNSPQLPVLELPALDGVLASLAEYVAIPSDSRNASPDTMRRAADWIARQLDFAAGRVEETDGHPVVRGEWLGAPGAPTVLVYGHYDVQPTGQDAEWLSPPFRLTVDGDIARGRGVSDDKGPVLLVVAMLQAVIAQRGALPLNVKFLIEGEEEIGSPHLPGYVRQHARELACDLVISADGAQWRPDEPSISVASKGLVAFTITVEGARDDLHSGRYGGTVANPVHVLSTVLASLHNPDGVGRRPWLLRRRDPAQRGSGERSWTRCAFDEDRVRRPARRPRDVRRARATPPCSGCGIARPSR